jgi:hypothetical protein
MKFARKLMRSSLVRLAVTAAVAAGALAGCAAAPAAGPAGCSQYQYSAGSTVNPDQPYTASFKVVLILLDLYSNAPKAAAEITREVGPYLQAAVDDGAYVKVEADGGTGTQVQSPGCFSGSEPFLVTRANATAQQKSQASAASALDSILTNFIESVKISPHGSATRLLQGAPQEVSSLRSGAPYPAGAVQVVLWSNLLGNAGSSDCLSVNGVPGTEAYARAIARRCFSEGELTPVPGASVNILGIGTGAVNDQQSLLANDLGRALCGEYGDGCQASPA